AGAESYRLHVVGAAGIRDVRVLRNIESAAAEILREPGIVVDGRDIAEVDRGILLRPRLHRERAGGAGRAGVLGERAGRAPVGFAANGGVVMQPQILDTNQY